MNKITGKFISIFFLITFLLASGGGQLIHAAFHDHTYTAQSNTATTAVNIPHSYCIALQLTLPEFFESGTCTLTGTSIVQDHCFPYFETPVPHLFTIKNSDRAPPVLA